MPITTTCCIVGKDTAPSWQYPPLTDQGYANRELYEYWAARDPIPSYAATLERDGVIGAGDLDRFKQEAEAIVEAQARAVIDAPWPDGANAGVGVFANEPPRMHVEVLDPEVRLTSERPASVVRFRQSMPGRRSIRKDARSSKR